MKKLFWLILSVLSFALLGFVYYSSHSEQIDIIKADYYLKNNDTASALKFYEQALDAGAKDSNARTNYVNLLINSSLDATSQEKLVKIINTNLGDAAEYKANSFLTDLRYEIHKLYPDNYISQGTYNQKIMRWSNNPITYGYIDADKAPEYYITEIDKAFFAWEHALNKKIEFKKVDKNPNIIISFNDTKIDVEKSEKYIAALTKPVISANTLKNMTIDYFLTSPSGEYFTENQIYNTSLHEIGHAIGFMGHSDYKKNVMHMTTDTDTVTKDLRKTLTKSDINTISLLYSIKPDITNEKNAKGEYTKYLVLGNENEVNSAKIREAKSYIQKAPNLPAGYIDLADSYVGTGEYSKALNALKHALALAKDNETISMINYNIALTSFYMEDYDNAKIYLEKSGDLKNTADSTRLMAEIYSKSGAKSEAIDMYEYLISKYPSNIEYVIALTNIYVRDNEYLKARKVLKRFISKNPQERTNSRLAPYGIIRLGL